MIEHTEPPVTAMLRNKLSLAMEQAEAHSDAVAKQEQTLARQIESYERLQKANANLVAQNKALVAENTALVAENAQLKDYQSHFKPKPGDEGMFERF